MLYTECVMTSFLGLAVKSSHVEAFWKTTNTFCSWCGTLCWRTKTSNRDVDAAASQLVSARCRLFVLRSALHRMFQCSDWSHVRTITPRGSWIYGHSWKWRNKLRGSRVMWWRQARPVRLFNQHIYYYWGIDTSQAAERKMLLWCMMGTVWLKVTNI